MGMENCVTSVTRHHHLSLYAMQANEIEISHSDYVVVE